MAIMCTKKKLAISKRISAIICLLELLLMNMSIILSILSMKMILNIVEIYPNTPDTISVGKAISKKILANRRKSK